MKAPSGASRIASGLAAWPVFLAIWLAASASLEPARVVTGLAVTALAAGLAVAVLPFWRGLAVGPGRVLAGLAFLLIFLRDMVTSNLAVLGYVYALRRQVSPCVVTIPVRITGARARLALTSALALTPGTLAIDLRADKLDMHLLDASLADGAAASVRTYETLLEKALG